MRPLALSLVLVCAVSADDVSCLSSSDYRTREGAYLRLYDKVHGEGLSPVDVLRLEVLEKSASLEASKRAATLLSSHRVYEDARKMGRSRQEAGAIRDKRFGGHLPWAESTKIAQRFWNETDKTLWNCHPYYERNRAVTFTWLVHQIHKGLPYELDLQELKDIELKWVRGPGRHWNPPAVDVWKKR